MVTQPPPDTPPSDTPAPSSGPSSGSLRRLRGIVALWRGDMPLADAFWTWAVFGGVAVNIATSVGFFALMQGDYVVPALLVGYGLSLPYNFIVTVGVWRAAGRHPGSRTWAEAARIVTLSWMIVLSLT